MRKNHHRIGTRSRRYHWEKAPNVVNFLPLTLDFKLLHCNLKREYYDYLSIKRRPNRGTPTGWGNPHKSRLRIALPFSFLFSLFSNNANPSSPQLPLPLQGAPKPVCAPRSQFECLAWPGDPQWAWAWSESRWNNARLPNLPIYAFGQAEGASPQTKFHWDPLACQVRTSSRLRHGLPQSLHLQRPAYQAARCHCSPAQRNATQQRSRQ